MVTLTSNCCNEPDRVFRKVLDMNFSEMGICPRCGEHCSFEDLNFVDELKEAVQDYSSNSFREAIHYGLQANMPIGDIVGMIKDQIKSGNYKSVCIAIGETLTNKIMAL